MKYKYCYRFFLLLFLVFNAATLMADNKSWLEDINTKYDVSLKAQPLSNALVELALQTNSNIIVEDISLKGLQSKKIEGLFSLNQTLKFLLEVHNLDFRSEKKRNNLIIYIEKKYSINQKNSPIILSDLVVSATETEDWTYSEPNSNAIVTQEQLKKIPPLHAADLVSETTGVFVSEDRGSPGLSVNIRGLQDFGRVNMMLDGARQNYQESGHGANGQAYIDPALIRQVEIKKGASSNTNGAGVIAGSINFVTIDAVDLISFNQTCGSQFDIAKGVTQYRNGYKFSGSLAGACNFNEFDILVAHSNRKTDNFKAGKKGSFTGDKKNDEIVKKLSTKYTEQDLDSTLLKVGWEPNEDSRLQLNYSQFNTELSYLGAAKKLNTSVLSSENLIFSYIDSNLELKLSRTAVKKDLLLHPATLFSRFEIHYETITTGGSLTREVEYIKKNNLINWRYGIEYYHDKTSPDAQQVNFQQEQNFARSFTGPTPSGERGIGSVYTELNIDINQLNIRLGLRYDHYRLLGKTYFILGKNDENSPLLWRAHLVDKDEGKILPTLGLGYALNSNLQFFTNFGMGWRPPAITETLMHGLHLANAGPPFSPNPNLSPEESTDYELGLNADYNNIFSHKDSFKTKVAVFYNKVDGYIGTGGIYFPVIRGLKIADDGYQYMGGVGFITLYKPLIFSGFEAKTEYYAESWYARAMYTYMDLDFKPEYDVLPIGGSDEARTFFHDQFKKDGARQALILLSPPRHKLVLDLGLKALNKKLTFGLKNRFFSENSLAGGPLNELKFKSSTIHDIYTSYKFSDKFKVRLTMENVTDQLYATPLTLSSSHIAPGRTVLFSLSAKF